MEKVVFEDLGKISYQDGWDYQQSLHDLIKTVKLKRRKTPEDPKLPSYQPHYLLFCEHNPVFTLGKSGAADHLLLKNAALKEMGFEFFKINRGGDITYHGPGQIVGYPIFDLERFFTDVHRYVRTLEEAIILTLQDFNIIGKRIDGYTGVWIVRPNGLKKKICAIGVHLSRWVSMHGFALNVNTELAHFEYIVPCGIVDNDKAITSMQQELNQKIELAIVKNRLKYHFANLFQYEYALVYDDEQIS